MPGTVTVTRTATNVTQPAVQLQRVDHGAGRLEDQGDAGQGSITPGASQTFKVTITSSAPAGQYFGQINIASKTTALHLPVAFFNQQGDVTLTQTCDPTTIQVRGDTTCDVTATNDSAGDTHRQHRLEPCSKRLGIVGATGATVSPDATEASTGPLTLAAPEDAIPAIAPGDTPGGGYLDLGLFGITPTSRSVTRRSSTSTSRPTSSATRRYTRIGVDSNGYVVVGGSDSASDISFEPQTFPDPTRRPTACSPRTGPTSTAPGRRASASAP